MVNFIKKIVGLDKKIGEVSSEEKLELQGRRTLLSLVFLGVAVYFGFEPLFKLTPTGVSQGVLGAAFGTIFVIIITMYLLNKQTEIEQESKKSERVFDEKVKLYGSTLESLEKILKDGILSYEEIQAANFGIYKLQMMAGDETINDYVEINKKLIEVFEKKSNESNEKELSQDEEAEIKQLLLSFSSNCRIDLGLSKKDLPNDVFREASAQVIAITSKGMRNYDLSKADFGDQKQIGKREFVKLALKYFVSKNSNLSSKQLEKYFPLTIHNEGGDPTKRKVRLYRKFDEIEEKTKCRYHCKEDDLLKLNDGSFAITNQWGLSNFVKFYKQCREIEILNEQLPKNSVFDNH
ncbi:MAG: hypothetical protein VXW53_01950 [Verrucomicrobiota bacterium]|nr:hypothetical protein [Verrucomicrobiota bacterium]